MEARNKHTKEICDVYWDMCDIGRRCEASDKPITPGLPCRDYNAIIDDYDVLVHGKWIDGMEYIKNPYAYWDKTNK